MYRLLIVDDETIIRNSLMKTINWAGMGVQVAAALSNGQEAMDYLSEHPADIIISDIRMPFMDGIELLKNVNERYSHIQMILLTGYAEFEYAKQALRYNACDYLLKPVQNEELERVIFRAVQELETDRSLMELKEKKDEEEKHSLLRRCLMGTASDAERDAIFDRVQDYALIVALYDFNESQIGKQRTYFEKVEKVINSPFARDLLGASGVQVCVVDLQPNKQCVFLQEQGGNGNLETGMIRRFANLIYEYITEKEQDLVLTVVYRYCGKNTKDISQYYNEMMSTLNHRHIFGINRVVESTSDFSGEQDLEILSYPSEEILEHIRYGQVEEVQADIETVYAKLLSGGVYASLSAVRNLSVELAIIIFRLQQTGGEKVSFLFFLNELQKLQTVDELKHKIMELALTLARENVGKYLKPQTRLAEEALDYIKKEYAANDLGLERVADALHVSATYLSIVLKRVTGYNFSAYLLHIRMNKAKELLQEDRLRLQDIAETVGYSSSQYFSVCFKKYTGMTPSQFREAANRK